MASIPAFYAQRLGRDVGPDGSRAALRATLAGSVDGVEHFLLYPGLVACLRGHGLSVCTGTINDPLLAARAACLGVDAITSDCPSELRSRMAAQAA